MAGWGLARRLGKVEFLEYGGGTIMALLPLFPFLVFGMMGMCVCLSGVGRGGEGDEKDGLPRWIVELPIHKLSFKLVKTATVEE